MSSGGAEQSPAGFVNHSSIVQIVRSHRHYLAPIIRPTMGCCPTTSAMMTMDETNGVSVSFVPFDGIAYPRWGGYHRKCRVEADL
jgi:hypothetical protein